MTTSIKRHNRYSAALLGTAYFANRFIHYFPGISKRNIFLAGTLEITGSFLIRTLEPPGNRSWNQVADIIIMISVSAIASYGITDVTKKQTVAVNFKQSLKLPLVKTCIVVLVHKIFHQEQIKKPQSASFHQWESLPPEIKGEVLEFLPVEDLARFRRVSKESRALVDSRRTFRLKIKTKAVYDKLPFRVKISYSREPTPFISLSAIRSIFARPEEHWAIEQICYEEMEYDIKGAIDTVLLIPNPETLIVNLIERKVRSNLEQAKEMALLLKDVGRNFDSVLETAIEKKLALSLEDPKARNTALSEIAVKETQYDLDCKVLAKGRGLHTALMITDATLIRQTVIYISQLRQSRGITYPDGLIFSELPPLG